MLCKNCIHFTVCANVYCEVTEETEIRNIHGKPCYYFKDKSQYIELPCMFGETLYVIDDRFEGLPQDVIKRLGKGNHSYKIECYEKTTYGTLLRLLIEKNKNSEQGYLMLFFTSKSETEQKLKELKENV